MVGKVFPLIRFMNRVDPRLIVSNWDSGYRKCTLMFTNMFTSQEPEVLNKRTKFWPRWCIVPGERYLLTFPKISLNIPSMAFELTNNVNQPNLDTLVLAPGASYD